MTYTTIQPIIQVETNRDNFSRLFKFVSLTIQQPFYTMPKQIASINKLKSNSPYVWGNKIKTFEWLKNHPQLLKTMYDAIPNLTDEEALGILCEVPGIGVAKGGFILQLGFNRVGCLDTHNYNTIYTINSILNDLNIKSNKDHKYNIKDYVSICHYIGSETLWDNWCKFIDDKYPEQFKDTDSSTCHLNWIRMIK